MQNNSNNINCTEISTIYLAADHRGVALKLYLTQMLAAAGYNVKNLGVDDPMTESDFPDVAEKLANAMAADPASRGVVICGFGGGVVMAANRFRHIRCTRVCTPFQASKDRIHDDANVIAFAADDIDIEVAFLCAKTFMETPFEAIPRRIRRIEKIS